MKYVLWALVLLCTAPIMSASEKGWLVESRDYDGEYTGVPVANGGIGILPWKEPFSVRQVMLNHVFEIGGQCMVNTAVRGINPFSLTMSVDGKPIDAAGISDWYQALDMRHASHNTSFKVADKLDVSYSIIALRNMPYSGMMRVKLKALADVDVALTAGVEVPEGEYRNVTTAMRTINADSKTCNILHTDAETAHGRYKAATSSMFIFDKGDFTTGASQDDSMSALVRLKKGAEAELTLVGSLCTSRDFSDPANEADREVVYMAWAIPDKLYADHVRRWDDLWQGDIEIEGDEEAQQVVRMALFNLYGFCREGSRLSVSPMGLSSQGYSGHVFWDTEIWMYPPMLFMNQGIARSMIDYRVDRLNAARRRALASGYSGAMFPWESDDFGEESTPTFAVTGSMEHHITADVAIAAWNYYRMTGDRDWLRDEGWPLIKAVAEFWISRVEPNQDGTYSIKHVVGADEYAIAVDDNAFTNGSAKVALRNASAAAAELGYTAPEEWSKVADGIRILKSADGVTLEHASYDGYVVKQADVNLLAYPLGLITDQKQIETDLDYYMSKMDLPNGPAMTFGIFCVEYARLGDEAKTEEMFRRSYRPNLRKPFGAMAETASSANPYFATGAGGLLQAVINGIGGLELTDDGIVQLPSVMPKGWRKLTIKGVGPDRRTYTVER